MTFTQRIMTRSHRSIAFSALFLTVACGGTAVDRKGPPVVATLLIRREVY